MMLAKALYDEAQGGNIAAIKESFDRVEGKVTDRQEITGAGGGPLQSEVTHTYQAKSDAELEAIIAEAERLIRPKDKI